MSDGTPTFAEQKKAWANPPVDDVGYLPSQELLTWDDEALLDLISNMAQSRYQGWRNWEMRWRTVLGLDSTRDKVVLDYGCGVGLEALQYAKLGNNVTIADIARSNVLLAERVLTLHGYEADTMVLPKNPAQIEGWDGIFDVIHCCGVLHHIPRPEPVVKNMARWLVDGGELRLMLYSDEAWRIATRTEPPEEGKVEDFVEFEQFWQHWDPLGGFADWYDRARLERRFGEWFHVSSCKPLTQHGEYLGAVLVKR